MHDVAQAAHRPDTQTSLLGQHWLPRCGDERAAQAMAQQLELPEILARVLAGRGVTADTAEEFLNPSLKTSLPDPSHLKDMDKGAARLARAVMNGEQIAIFGDYDVDGATSSALLHRFLTAAGGRVTTYIPDRIKEGYGPNTPALLALRTQGVTLAITVDCGTVAFEPIRAAKNAGLDIIVVDHHLGEARLPDAVAVINPNRLDEESPHTQLAAVGVAFLLAVAVNKRLREENWYADRAEPNLLQWLDIVALGTICDVVKLTGVNRAFVSQGLKVMAARGNTGLRALMDLAGLTEKPGTYAAGYILGPRINAGGRVGKSDLGTRLLSTDDETEAAQIARELDLHNKERKAIESLMLEEAFAQAEAADPAQPMLLLHANAWHPGVIGIIAGRVKDRYHKPVAIVAMNDGVGKASVRSVSGIDIGAHITAARIEGFLVAGGGHAMAAGFTVEENKFPSLCEFLHGRLSACQKPTERILNIDGEVHPAGLTVELVREMEKAGPFGAGNPPPRLVLRAVRLVKPSVVGENHVRGIIVDASLGKAATKLRLSVIAFRAAGTKLGDAMLSGAALHLAGQPRISIWQGVERVEFHVDDGMIA